VPSTLHQFLIQWVGDEVEIVHGEASTCVAVVLTPNIGTGKRLTLQHPGIFPGMLEKRKCGFQNFDLKLSA
jgi:hypothetical protein